ncbi:hypothetical protein HN587_07020 [Candidatus Woesearchaeota archaeon]|jgi:hypothetical protein|nr:hypothetical protein [Candidatus Woesearchaeota archaeon]
MSETPSTVPHSEPSSGKSAVPRISATKAHRLRCFDCVCGNRAEIRACSSTQCRSWIFRLGYPYSKKQEGNPFLDKSLFVGLENMSATEFIKHIKSLNINSK